jgi:hypothetical protein
MSDPQDQPHDWRDLADHALTALCAVCEEDQEWLKTMRKSDEVAITTEALSRVLLLSSAMTWRRLITRARHCRNWRADRASRPWRQSCGRHLIVP